MVRRPRDTSDATSRGSRSRSFVFKIAETMLKEKARSHLSISLLTATLPLTAAAAKAKGRAQRRHAARRRPPLPLARHRELAQMRQVRVRRAIIRRRARGRLPCALPCDRPGLELVQPAIVAVAIGAVRERAGRMHKQRRLLPSALDGHEARTL